MNENHLEDVCLDWLAGPLRGWADAYPERIWSRAAASAR